MGLNYEDSNRLTNTLKAMVGMILVLPSLRNVLRVMVGLISFLPSLSKVRLHSIILLYLEILNMTSPSYAKRDKGCKRLILHKINFNLVVIVL